MCARRDSPPLPISVSPLPTMVPRVRVVTDSTADVPPALAEELGITVIHANVHFGAVSFLDGLTLTKDEFYRRLVEGPVMPITSAPAPGVFTEVYQRLHQEAKQAGQPLEGIVSIHLASQLSGLFNVARLGAEDAPEVDVRLVDSRQLSFATGWLAVLAARAARQGQSLEQVTSLVEERVPRLRLVAMLDTLDYVRRSGRMGKVQWLIGTLLDIKVLLEVRDGQIRPLPDRVRTRRRGMERLVEVAAEMGPFEEMAVVHAHAPQSGQELLAQAAGLHPPERTLFAEIGVIIGAYAGPGAVGIIGISKTYGGHHEHSNNNG